MNAMNEPSNYDPLEFYHHLAKEALGKYSVSSHATVRLLNYSENITYLVENTDNPMRTILRLNRPGYHSKKELEAELIWIKAILESSTIVVPEPIAGINGEYVQVIATDKLGNPYHCVMFSFLAGNAPDEENEQGLVLEFEKLGEITALLHNQSQEWIGSNPINRPTWDFETMLGTKPKWGRWQDGIAVTPDRKILFQKVSKIIKKRLTRFGKSSDRFGLIHADLRLANLLVEDGIIKVIDFDDCGFSWYLYDLATALSFIEHKEYVPDLIQAWLSGYKKIRSISVEEEAEIPTFIMLRRLLLVAWIGSHIDNDTAKSLGAEFTDQTVGLAEKYLYQFG
ncbi:phosphotransferase enzyme family protein [Aneurinibacillus danicus]|uniref:Aminoglycoside phosphotransferase n=1 Tax=Aneurinibacillus danicus TaxID=267746 RepID=A0A511V8E5_9BACL|nr:phosphotransferase [Aneurinibacillus danicus]GEN35216.1 aminoglycoside phosphotransferase [Aneurinibacillus danicus]